MPSRPRADAEQLSDVSRGDELLSLEQRDCLPLPRIQFSQLAAGILRSEASCLLGPADYRGKLSAIPVQK
jgi:hypothetical protein